MKKRIRRQSSKKSLWRKIASLLIIVVTVGLMIRAWGYIPQLRLIPVMAQESFHLPIFGTFTVEEEPRLVIAHKDGLIKWGYKEDERASGTLLDLRDRVFWQGHEEGLQSIALDPNFSSNPHLYVFYNLSPPLRTRISRFKVNSDFVADPKSEEVLIELTKPNIMHNGGMLLFGKDGFLYAGFGDGFLPEKERHLLSNQSTILGSIIRIDVRSPGAYKIPIDNPWQKPGQKAEIYANGFRNPWRFQFDPETDALIVGDVGDQRWEEINIVKKGENYGWPIMEGTECYKADECDKVNRALPIAAFSHKYLRAITAGFVYRGREIEDLKGKYVFACYMRGIYSIPYAPDDQKDVIRLPKRESYKMPALVGSDVGEQVHLANFFEDKDRELYTIDLSGGVYRIVAAGFFYKLRSFLYAMVTFT